MTASEQARADAIADAETLRRMLHTQTIQALPYSPAPVLLLPEPNGLVLGYYEGSIRAHVAFRAVPGLRGEDTSGRR